MSQCTTQQGVYRCKKSAGHADDCEADDITRVSFGPYTDGFRGRAYLRGWLDAAQDSRLDVIGLALGIRRHDRETDHDYRERLWSVKS